MAIEEHDLYYRLLSTSVSHASWIANSLVLYNSMGSYSRRPISLANSTKNTTRSSTVALKRFGLHTDSPAPSARGI
jgi:hypothetical protein